MYFVLFVKFCANHTYHCIKVIVKYVEPGPTILTEFLFTAINFIIFLNDTVRWSDRILETLYNERHYNL